MNRTGRTTRDRDRGRAPDQPVAQLADRRRGSDRTRRRTSRRRRLLQVLVPLAVLAGAGAWVALGSPLLEVQQVEVDGATTLTAGEVRAAAGVVPGTSLVRVDTAAAAGRVGRLPQVASVQVTRGWPDSVVITLVERTPVAVVTDAGVRTLVDAGGVGFATVSGDAPGGVVPLDVPTPGPDDAATRAGLAVLASLPPSVREAVTEVRATGGDDVTLLLTAGRTVLWGGEGDADRKATVLAALLQQIDAGTLDTAATIDVSVPDAVLLR